ncbi:hypothetical protein Y032_0505g2656 [Ancylostoma ceylanicum]|nr:hypothetical protein Y032_0505g2656 [Ancylostoma ceylanicum]
MTSLHSASYNAMVRTTALYTSDLIRDLPVAQYSCHQEAQNPRSIDASVAIYYLVSVEEGWCEHTPTDYSKPFVVQIHLQVKCYGSFETTCKSGNNVLPENYESKNTAQ